MVVRNNKRNIIKSRNNNGRQGWKQRLGYAGDDTTTGRRRGTATNSSSRMKRLSSFVLVGVGVFMMLLQMRLLFLQFPVTDSNNEGETSAAVSTSLSLLSYYYYATSSRPTTTTKKDLQQISSSTKKTTTNLVEQDPPHTPAEKEKKYQRIYCIVPFLWQPPKSTARYEEIMNTWGKRCDYIRFMIDPLIGSFDTFFTDVRYNETARATLPDNVRIINMTRPWNRDCSSVNEVKDDTKTLHGSDNYLNGRVCRHLWEKMWKTWTYIYDNELHLADWFVKIDWDCYFFPNHLRHYINTKGYSTSDRHYIGHSLHHHQASHNVSLIAGAYEILSQATIKDIVPHLLQMPSEKHNPDRLHCRDRPLDGEDVTLAVCLQEHLDLLPEPARTPIFGCDYISLQEFNDYLLYNRTEQGEWWYWQGKPSNQQYGCLTDSPIGFHSYKRLGSLYELEDQFYHVYDRNNISIVNTSPQSSPILQKYMGSNSKSILNMRLSNNPKAKEYITRVRKHIINEDPLNIKREREKEIRRIERSELILT